MTMNQNQPIAALATASSGGAIAIIRLSGENCHQLLLPMLKFKIQKMPAFGHMKLCEFINPATGIVIDEPMVVFFKGPHSYTGEDTVELYLHAGSYIIQSALSLLYENGFFPAEPGEFTQRAYLNGKMDLTAAEGIKELIEASSEQQWMAARQLSSGKLARFIEDLRQKLLEAMAWLEARIDFPDEKETSDVEMEEVYTRVNKVMSAINKVMDTYQGGQVATSGLSVALIGKPNVGKSTLLNELLGKERAIVTDIAGTTRDYIEEKCLVQGRLIRLIDTAGIRNTQETVEQIGVAQSLEFIEKSDIVMFMAVSDSTEEDLKEIDQHIKSLKQGTYLRVMTKSDLLTVDNRPKFQDWIQISCLDQTGIDQLKNELAAKVDSYVQPIKDEVFITAPRHLHALKESLEALNRFQQAADEGMYEDMLAFELLEAGKALVSIIGEVDSDEVLGVVFGAFCVGK